MRPLTDSVDIDAPAEEVWSWLEGMAEHYDEWHRDHVSAKWRLGGPGEVGAVLEAVEYIGGRRERLQLEITELDPPRYLEYRVRGFHSLLLRRGSFEVTAHDNCSRFTASIYLRGGPIAERLFRRRLLALRDHMQEEGQNLQLLLATNPPIEMRRNRHEGG